MAAEGAAADAMAVEDGSKADEPVASALSPAPLKLAQLLFAFSNSADAAEKESLKQTILADVVTNSA